ncbi:MAG: polysaccharide deacetylase family protein [Streptosporangiaceae bacterium]
MGIVLAAATAGSALVAVASTPAAAGPQTVISLTFDDGLKDQYANILPTLKATGVKATFYVVSGRVYEKGTSHDDPKQMSWAEIKSVADAGNEIGGHTVDHWPLDSQTAAGQEDAIKRDVENLRAQGYDPRSFAYPKGDYNATSIDLVKKYGYTTARRVGPITLATALKVETIPPADVLQIRAPGSFKRGTTLDQLKNYVTNAEATGGWLPLIFHNVCDGPCPASAAYDYGIPKDIVSEFIVWLKAREGQGTVVKTMSSVLQNNLNADVATAITGPTNGRAGSAVAYDVTTTNNGPSTGENVSTKITVPATGVTAPAGCQVTQAVRTADVNCGYGVLGVAQSKVTRIRGKLAGAVGSVVHTTADAKTTTPDKAPANNRADVLTGIDKKNPPKADFRAALATPKTWKRGKTYTIKVAVKNYGPSTAKYVVVNAKLSPGLTIVNRPGCTKVSKTTLHCTSKAFLPGKKFVFYVKVRVSKSKSLKKVGFWVTGTTTTLDPKKGNNKASFTRKLKK